MKLITTIKAEAAALALQKLVGVRPIVADVAGRAVLRWRDEDLPVARAWLEAQMRGGGPESDIAVDLVPVVGPYAARTVLPVAVGIGILGFILGRL